MFILVTGGAGFIGSNIVKYLLEEGHRVRVIDNLVTGYKTNLDEFKSNPMFEFIYGDITNIEHLRKACAPIKLSNSNSNDNNLIPIDGISHQAALGSVPRSIDDPLESHKSNINGFLNLLLVAKEYEIKRIVYASSSAVYGDHHILPKVEENIGNPLSPYAITKYVDELYGQLFTKLYGIEAIGFRYFNVFGPKQDPNGAYAAVIPKFIDSIKNNISPIINGDGTYSRDFTFVDNIVQANYLGLTTTNPECFGQIFNIGAGGRITIREMYDQIAQLMNSDLKPILGPIRLGDIPHSNADISKAKKLLGYNPKFSFVDGIVKTLEFYI